MFFDHVCFLCGVVVKSLPVIYRCGFDPWVRKTPWRRKWQTATVFLPGKFQGQRSLVGCCSQGHRVACDWAHSTLKHLFLVPYSFISSRCHCVVSSYAIKHTKYTFREHEIKTNRNRRFNIFFFFLSGCLGHCSWVCPSPILETPGLWYG